MFHTKINLKIKFEIKYIVEWDNILQNQIIWANIILLNK